MLKDVHDQAWLKGRFAMHKDLLEESWVYQEIVQEGLQKGMQKGIEQGLQQGVEQERQRQRQALVSVVQGVIQGRFPELTDLAEKRAKAVEPAQLQALLIKIGLAKDLEEARQALMEIGNS